MSAHQTFPQPKYYLMCQIYVVLYQQRHVAHILRYILTCVSQSHCDKYISELTSNILQHLPYHAYPARDWLSIPVGWLAFMIGRATDRLFMYCFVLESEEKKFYDVIRTTRNRRRRSVVCITFQHCNMQKRTSLSFCVSLHHLLWYLYHLKCESLTEFPTIGFSEIPVESAIIFSASFSKLSEELLPPLLSIINRTTYHFYSQRPPLRPVKMVNPILPQWDIRDLSRPFFCFNSKASLLLH